MSLIEVPFQKLFGSHCFSIGVLLWTIAYVVTSCSLSSEYEAVQNSETMEMSYEAFSHSQHSEWILLPKQTKDISIRFFAGMDINYRFVDAQLTDGSVEIRDLLQANVLHCSRPPTDKTYLTNAVFSRDILKNVFPQIFDHMPPEWNQIMSRFDTNIIESWAHGIYGYGYWIFYSKEDGLIRIFQWSQQHMSPYELEIALRGEREPYKKSSDGKSLR